MLYAVKTSQDQTGDVLRVDGVDTSPSSDIVDYGYFQFAQRQTNPFLSISLDGPRNRMIRAKMGLAPSRSAGAMV